MAQEQIRLADAVQNLRRELISAVEAGKDEPLRFDLEEVKLELNVVLASEARGDAGVKFYVFNVGASGSDRTSETQKITLTLKPATQSGGNVKLSRR